jgi:transcriptional regulator with XRE-family HTH domain
MPCPILGNMPRRWIGRNVRLLRRRRGWRQRDLAAAAGLSQPTVSRIERDLLDKVTFHAIVACVGALNAHLRLDLFHDGEQVTALRDAEHAAIQDWLASTLASWAWETTVEVSFNHYGDRGRIDVLAFDRASRVLLVAEVKSRIDDAQETVGRIDVKARVAPELGRARGWLPSVVVTALIVGEDRTSRRRVVEHPALFARFPLRGRGAIAWLRRRRGVPPGGLLFFVRLPAMRHPNAASISRLRR